MRVHRHITILKIYFHRRHQHIVSAQILVINFVRTRLQLLSILKYSGAISSALLLCLVMTITITITMVAPVPIFLHYVMKLYIVAWDHGEPFFDWVWAFS